jgi:hypothetical protein
MPYLAEFAKKDIHVILLKCLDPNAIGEVRHAALEVIVNLTNLQEGSYFNLLMGAGLLQHMLDTFDVKTEMLRGVLDVLGNISKVSVDCRVIILEVIGLRQLFTVLCENIKDYSVFRSSQELIYNLGFSFNDVHLLLFLTELQKVFVQIPLILPKCGLLLSVLLNNSDNPNFAKMAINSDVHSILGHILDSENLPEWITAHTLTFFGVIFAKESTFAIDPLIFRRFLESNALSIRASAAMAIWNMCRFRPFVIAPLLESGVLQILRKMITEGQLCETMEAVMCLASLICFSEVSIEVNEQEVIAIFVDFILTSGSDCLEMILMAMERVLKAVIVRNGSGECRKLMGIGGMEALEGVMVSGCEESRVVAERIMALVFCE